VNDLATKASVVFAKYRLRQGVIAGRFRKRSFAVNVVVRRQVGYSPKKKVKHLKFRNGMACSIVATFAGVCLTAENTNARSHATHKMRISLIAHNPLTWFGIALAGKRSSTKFQIEREPLAQIRSLLATNTASNCSIAVTPASRFVMRENVDPVSRKFQSSVAVGEHLQSRSATKVR
jgi:hypothetical protein